MRNPWYNLDDLKNWREKNPTDEDLFNKLAQEEENWKERQVYEGVRGSENNIISARLTHLLFLYEDYYHYVPLYEAAQRHNFENTMDFEAEVKEYFEEQIVYRNHATGDDLRDTVVSETQWGSKRMVNPLGYITVGFLDVAFACINWYYVCEQIIEQAKEEGYPKHDEISED